MNLSDILPAVRSAADNLAAQITLGKALGGMALTQTAELAGSTVATTADVLQRVIDGAITASAGDEAELRTIYDQVLAARADLDAFMVDQSTGALSANP